MAAQGKKPAFTKGMALMSGVVTVMVLAAVIFLISALGAPRGAADKDVATQVDAFVQQANQALESGDTTLAATLAQKASELDPASKAASDVTTKVRKAQADAEKSASSPSPGSSGGTSAEPEGSDAPVDDSAFDKKIADKAVLLPKSFADYLLGDATATDAEAQVSATPKSASAAGKQVIWTVHETGSAKAAQEFVTKTSKALYAEDGKSVTIDGASAYVGTDGTRYATATYVRGIYVFEVLVSGDVDPAQNVGLAVDAAKAFGDSAQ